MLDAYATQRCPVKLQHRLDDHIVGVSNRSSSLQRRIDAGIAHERSVINALVHAGPDGLVIIDGGDRDHMQAATLEAMVAQRRVIAGGWLGADDIGRRVGRPDLLVLHDGGYLPVEIKLHLLTTEGQGSVATSSLSTPFPEAATAQTGRKFRRGRAVESDGLQLAHYRRMLEAHGLASADQSVLGGVIDGSGTLWWIPVDLRRGGRKSLVETYDQAFAERIVLADATVARNADRSLPRPVNPWWHKECEGCEFETICHDELEAIDDVSLVRWSTPATLDRLRSAGVETRRGLARLDLGLVALARRLADTTLPLSKLLELARSQPTDTELATLVGSRMGVRRRLEIAGLLLVADLVERDPVTLSLLEVNDLDRLIRRARAWQAGGAVRTVHAHEIDAARGDVEVDIDMESYDHATYLWGALVTCRTPMIGIDEGYRAFVEFDRLDAEIETDLFRQLWTWLSALRAEVRRQGRSIRVYCFWRSAEEGQMRRALVADDDLPSARSLERFFASDEWIDLHQIVADQILTEGPLGLKALAARAGFSWRDEDPSGEASMAWFEEAAGGDLAARQRLLAYNEDDVLATRALREWLDGPARSLPHLDDGIDAT